MTKEETLSKVKGYLTDLFPFEEYNEVEEIIEALKQEPTVQDKQAESEKYQKAFDDGYTNGYEQARFDYEPKTGQWIVFDDRYNKCSKCGFHYDTWNNRTEGLPIIFNYCPSCGMKIQEVGK